MSRKPFDLRQQVGKLVVTKLTVFPANPEAGVVLGETKTVSSDHSAVLQNDVVAEAAAFADYSMRMREEIAANGRAGVNHRMRKQDGVLADGVGELLSG